MSSYFNKITRNSKGVAVCTAAVVFAASAGNAFANPQSDAVFAAADLAGFLTALGALALIPIGISILWASVRNTKRAISYT